jgi:protein farnesyltransferase subunit beta
MATQEAQEECEQWHDYIMSLPFEFTTDYLISQHTNYCFEAIRHLSGAFVSLDASQTWLCYWNLHSLELLGCDHLEQFAPHVISKLKMCQNSQGGFGGGAGQISHLATTYSGVLALMTVGTREAYNVIDRDSMYEFLMRLKQPDGSFIMHFDGEVDVRGSYCALSVAYMLNIMTPQLVDKAAEFIGSCQTYEGGLGATPGNEAHGGYTFCGIASLALLNRFDVIDLDMLAGWLTRRQMSVEGGMNGRTNKLVDGCYGFWQGAVFPLLHAAFVQRGDLKPWDNFLLDETELRRFLFRCAQKPEGGFTDRYDRRQDYYHTCYCLSGLSICEHRAWPVLGTPHELVEPEQNEDETRLMTRTTHPIFNISASKVEQCFEFFHSSTAGQIQ